MQQSHSVTTTILQNTINMIIIILIMLLPIIDTAIPPTIVDKPYWISIELKSIDWRLGGCLNTGGCAQPRLNIVLSNEEMMSISWPINTHDIVQNARPFITHWSKGKSTDIALICEIVGIDPIYAFPRICDTTNKQQFVDDSSIKHSTTDQQSTITIRGKCFNVTLIVQSYSEHCPWCNHHYRSTSDDNLLVDFDNSSLLNRFINRFHFSRIIIIITFAIVFVVITTALIITIIAYCRLKKYYSRQLQQSKSNRTTTTINRYHQDHQVRLLHHHHQLVDDEIKYDIPWQQQSLPDWLVKSTEINANNNNNSSMSRTLINGQHRYSLSSNNSRNNHQQSSPNNSTTLIDNFDAHHDDSGLESV